MPRFMERDGTGPDTDILALVDMDDGTMGGYFDEQGTAWYGDVHGNLTGTVVGLVLPQTIAAQPGNTYLVSYDAVTGLFGTHTAPFTIAKAVVHLTPTNIKALYATPILVLAPLGSMMWARPISLCLQYKAGTTPYTIGSGGPLGVRYVGDIAADLVDTAAAGLIDQSISRVVQQYAGNYGDAQTAVDNVGIEIYNTGTGEYTAGNGDLYVTLLYEFVTLF